MTDKRERMRELRKQMEYAAERAISAQLSLAESGEESPSAEVLYWVEVYTSTLEEIENL